MRKLFAVKTETLFENGKLRSVLKLNFICILLAYKSEKPTFSRFVFFHIFFFFSVPRLRRFRYARRYYCYCNTFRANA